VNVQEKLTRLLAGKTIREVRASDRPFMGAQAIEDIVFEDGSVLELGGQADEAYIEALHAPEGRISVGRDGSVTTVDPEGEVYEEGP
jgi:hypothetical protein